MKNNLESVHFLEEQIFPKIYDENVILFLGAGFSYTKEKNYLGKTIIDYYQEVLKVDLETNDLVEFVDRASRLDNFSRNQFDQYVSKLLQRLKPEETHKKVVRMGWRQIVTTNLDLMLESSYSEIIGKADEYKEIVPVRSVSEYQSSLSNDQIKYIKLNGCLSDISKYKLVFSTQDFEDNKQFFNLVLSNFSSLSNDVCFLSIGYSFTDGISKRLLKELKKNNLKNDKKIFNIDPFPNEGVVPYLEENNVITVRMTSEEFFTHYENWVKEKHKRADKKLPKAYFKGGEGAVHISTKLKLRLLPKVKQLHKNNRDNTLKPENYYKGEEPNYSIILDNHDVIKRGLTDKIVESIKNSSIENNLIPVNFITGSYGIGKSTSALRALSELQSKHGYTAFELIDINGLRAQDLEELFSASSTENIVLLADNVERHTFFKELMNFRLSLSEYQFNRNISILAPIRENMLENNLRAYSYKNINKISAEHLLTNDEIDDLIGKLKNYRLIKVRDKFEENKIKEQIKKNYNSDPYVTMLSIIENSTVLRVVSDTLSQINADAQLAFEFTSLLYQYRIPLPASILKRIISMDWEEFKKNVLYVDCKGLLIHEFSIPSDIKEDLVFRTKHRIISS
ncbi:MAG: SIR2 family protein, partial [Bacteroidia bacterium]